MESDSTGESRSPPESARTAGRRLATASLLLVLAVTPTVWASIRLSGDARWLHHTYDVLETLYASRASMRQATTALHAYLRTGEKAVIPQYQLAVSAAWRDAWRFKELTIDNPVQVAAAKILEQKLADYFRWDDKLIAARGAGQPTSTEERIDVEGRFGDALRDIFGVLIDEERKLLEQREADMRRSILVLELSCALFVAVIALLASLMWSRLRALLLRS